MKQYDVFGIGNALLDTEYAVSDQFLIDNDVTKARMTLVDWDRRQQLLSAIKGEPSSVAAGGSVANSLIALQGFHCSSYFTGRVTRDSVGTQFLTSMTEADIDCNPPVEDNTGNTGQCLIFVTPDGERSMNTYLGVANSFQAEEISQHSISDSNFVYVEGYLATTVEGTNSSKRTMQLARDSGVQTSLTLADVSIIELFRESLEHIAEGGLDLLFCNMDEALAWCRTDSEDHALTSITQTAKTCIVTASVKGCYIATRDTDPVHIPGFPVQPMNSNGAGDMFAGAYLAGVCNGWYNTQSARFANYAASQIVLDYGARLPTLQRYQQLLDDFIQSSHKKGISLSITNSVGASLHR